MNTLVVYFGLEDWKQRELARFAQERLRKGEAEL